MRFSRRHAIAAAGERLVHLLFGDCLLDTATRELRRGGAAVHLEPKAFRLLELLVESRPRVLTHAELVERLWPHTYVARSGLGRLVSQLRGALGDSARAPRYLRTVHGVGYAFGAEAIETSVDGAGGAPPRFWLLWGNRTVPLPVGDHLLGRDPACTLVLEALGVSRRHARLRVTADGATVSDLGSKNGTLVDDRRLDGPAELADGDEIQVGTVTLTVRSAPGHGPTATLPLPGVTGGRGGGSIDPGGGGV